MKESVGHLDLKNVGVFGETRRHESQSSIRAWHVSKLVELNYDLKTWT